MHNRKYVTRTRKPAKRGEFHFHMKKCLTKSADHAYSMSQNAMKCNDQLPPLKDKNIAGSELAELDRVPLPKSGAHAMTSCVLKPLENYRAEESSKKPTNPSQTRNDTCIPSCKKNAELNGQPCTG